jgi:tRNA(Ile)-lysidine synthase TilS/MesJ
VDWDKRKKEFEELVRDAKSRKKGYDCMIPVSGGKDSTWQVVRCLEYGLKPLAFTQKVPLRTKLGQQNLDNLVALGVDHIEYQVSPKVEAKFVKEAFMKMGSVGLPMHMAMYRMSLNMAAKFDIPYVIWGENSAAMFNDILYIAICIGNPTEPIFIKASFTNLASTFGLT